MPNTKSTTGVYPATVIIRELQRDGDRATFTATATFDRLAIGVDALRPVIGRELQLVFDVVAGRG